MWNSYENSIATELYDTHGYDNIHPWTILSQYRKILDTRTQRGSFRHPATGIVHATVQANNLRIEAIKGADYSSYKANRSIQWNW